MNSAQRQMARLSRVLEYIRQHLDDKLDAATLSHVAHFRARSAKRTGRVRARSVRGRTGSNGR